jgi:hypothetical protein
MTSWSHATASSSFARIQQTEKTSKYSLKSELAPLIGSKQIGRLPNSWKRGRAECNKSAQTEWHARCGLRHSANYTLRRLSLVS